MDLLLRSSATVRRTEPCLYLPCDADVASTNAAEEYKPLLEELARMQEQAGIDAAAAKAGARAGLGAESRNRR